MLQFDEILKRKGTNCAKWDRQGGDFLPMYTHIRRLPEEARAEVTEVPMKEKNLFYTMDFDALERAVTSKTGVYVLCNPHNPVGRVFTRNELEHVADFAKRNKTALPCAARERLPIFRDFRWLMPSFRMQI